MTDSNPARFTINSTPSEDPVTGDRGYAASVSETINITLEDNPSSAFSVTYRVYDASISDSPLASLSAPLLTFVASGTATQVFTAVNDTAQLILPASGVHSWLVRCTASTDKGGYVFERMISIHTGSSPTLRKLVPGETGEYLARGFADDYDQLIDVIDAAIGSGGTLTVQSSAVATETILATSNNTGSLSIGLSTGSIYLVTAELLSGVCDDCDVEIALTTYGTPPPIYQIGQDSETVPRWNPTADGDWYDSNTWGINGVAGGLLYYRITNNDAGTIQIRLTIYGIGVAS